MRNVLKFILVAFAVAFIGCGDDPVNFSKPVALNLKAKSGDVSGSTVSAEKGINTESGNPYGAFVTEAKNKLGKDPARIEVSSLEILLSTASTNVAALNEVFAGAVDVQFVMNDTNNTYAVGHATIDASTSGRGPRAFTVDFDAAAMVASVDWQKFIGGSFKVVIAGPAAASFSGKGAEANFQVSLMFAAFE